MLSINSARALAIAGALFTASAAFAQAPAPGQAPTALPQVTQAQMDKLTPAQIAVGKEVVVLSGIYRTFNAFVPSIMQQIYNTLTPTRPELRKDLEETLKALMPEYEKRTEEMIEHTAKLFAASMPEADLRAVATFFKSAAGKQYVEMQPRVIDQMVVAVDEWNRKMTEEILSRARVEMKKKGKDM